MPNQREQTLQRRVSVHHLQEPSEHDGAAGTQKVLPPLQQAHWPQRDQVVSCQLSRVSFDALSEVEGSVVIGQQSTVNSQQSTVNKQRTMTYFRRRVSPIKPGDPIDYKDVDLLKKYVTERGKILPRRITGLTARQQRDLTRSIKRARIVALMPFVNQEG